MRRLLAILLAPLGAISALIGGSVLAVKTGLVDDATQFWLWGALVTLFLLAACIVAFLKRLYLLLWPLGSGFLVALVTYVVFVLLEGAGGGDTRWWPLQYALLSIGVVLLVMLAVYLFNTARARLLERKMAAGAGGDSEDAERIRKDMLEALDLLRRAGRGRNAIYELPWFLVMGRPAAGKTVAIKNSELGLPVKRDWVKGVGGTYTADWFFTNEMIFLDTPGKWVTEGANEDGQIHWRELIRLLQKYRGRQPLDGLIVVVPADDLLSLTDQQLEDQAANIREVVDLIHSELNFRFPIYLLVSKCDLVEGFVDFFKVLPAKRRHEILGWSNDDPNCRDVSELIEEGFERVNRHLGAYRIEMLGKVAKRSQARRLFFFTEEFKSLGEPLITFAESLFSGDRYSDSPVFRGFYFTSGTQEGAPLSKAVAELSRTLGVPALRAIDADTGEKKRSYFLLDLFRDVMVGDDGLVGRTAGHRWRLRRNTFLGAFAPAGIGLLFLLLSLIAFTMNCRTYSRVERTVENIAERLAAARASNSEMAGLVQASLPLTEQLRRQHSEMAGFSLFRRFGMRRPGDLKPRLFELYRREFTDSVLEPTLTAASDLAVDSERSCAVRIGVLHGAVWLRMGRSAGHDQLVGLDPVWGLENQPTQADQVRRQLLRQYQHLKRHGSADDLLPGFNIKDVARSIASECGKQGDRSTLAVYRQFQTQCSSIPANEDIDRCWVQLRGVFQNSRLDFEGFSKKLAELRNDLEKLRSEGEETANQAFEELGTIDLQQQTTGGCLATFDQDVVPMIETYARKDELVRACQSAVEEASGVANKYAIRQKVLSDQEGTPEMVKEETSLGKQFFNYGQSCGGTVPGFLALDLATLKKVVSSHRRLDCYRQDTPAPRASRSVPVTRQPVGVARAPRPSATSSYRWFEAPSAVPSAYRPSNWESQKAEWQGRLSATDVGFTPEQKQAEIAEVSGRVAGYASAYARHWIDYLESLRLKSPPTGSLAAWLKALSETKEYEQLIGKAKDAAALANQNGDPPFDALEHNLEPLRGLDSLNLNDYQANLKKVASELARCEADPQVFLEFRSSLRQGRADNPLVSARDWVSRNAGAAVLRGSLKDVLMAPLERAEAFVASDNLLKGQWQALTSLYRDDIQGRPPFSGDLLSGEAASFDSIKALLGGQTGAVAQVRRAAGGSQLSDEVKAWLARAEKFSALLFKEGSDAPREIKLLLELQEPNYTEKEFEKNFKLEGVKLDFVVSEFEWDVEEDTKQLVRLPLLGEGASEYAVVMGDVRERKNLGGRMFGDKFKEGEKYEAVLLGDAAVPARAEGGFAPLQLVKMGWRQGSQLGYALEIPWKKKKTARIELGLEISGNDWDVLSDLMTNGLPAPPASATGG